jgi:hypothetical protein
MLTRPKTPLIDRWIEAEVRRADEQAARLASAVTSLVRGLTRPVRAARRPFPAAGPGLPRPA